LYERRPHTNVRPMDRPKSRPTDHVFYGLLVLTALLFVFEIFFVFLKTPIEARMGIVQKIFYFHVPSAYSMYVGATACFLGSIAYLVKPTDARDALGRAGAEAAVTFGAIMLTTGPLWGAKAWGAFWTWDPRLHRAPQRPDLRRVSRSAVVRRRRRRRTSVCGRSRRHRRRQPADHSL
jgi:ABC-type transport system involved in cytochrome c biogenesis permease subunit